MDKILEATKRWLKDFSLIPTDLIVRAYKNNLEDIIIVAPKDEDTPLIPMYGYVFVPEDPTDKKWLEKNAEKIAKKCDVIIYYTDEIGYYIGIDGAGYDFYEAHWVPMYRLRGLEWHKQL